MSDTLEPYDSQRDTPHPMVETWAVEWTLAFYVGTDQTLIQRIELARLAFRERAERKRLETELAAIRSALEGIYAENSPFTTLALVQEALHRLTCYSDAEAMRQMELDRKPQPPQRAEGDR